MEIQTEQTQYNRNKELLENPECGSLLAEVYDAATAIDPRLKDVMIVPFDVEKNGVNGSAFALGADISKSGKHEVHVRTDNLYKTLKVIESTLDKVPGLRETISKRLKIEDPEDLSPMQVHAFVILHELGHITEFMDNEDTMQELRQRQKIEKDALPIGDIATYQIIDPSTSGVKYIRQRWKLYSELFEVDSIEELAQIRQDAYSRMTSEVIADDFATDVMNSEPILLEQLGKYQ